MHVLHLHLHDGLNLTAATVVVVMVVIAQAEDEEEDEMQCKQHSKQQHSMHSLWEQEQVLLGGMCLCEWQRAREQRWA
jgi:predicted secreted acid phosphatase